MNTIQDEAPQEFLCPITREIMVEPVTLVETSQVYDKLALQEWFDRGKRTCPLTGRYLTDLKIIPNYPLRDLIRKNYGAKLRAAATAKDFRRQATMDNTAPKLPAQSQGGCWTRIFCSKKQKKKLQSSPTMVSRLTDGVHAGNVELVRKLLEDGVSINGLDEAGRSPLHSAVIDGNVVMVEELISCGADVNGEARDSCSPLHFAAHFNHILVARILLGKDADVNKQTNQGYTPLHKAAFYGRRDMCMLLLKSGADRNVRNIDKNAPVDLAALSGARGAKDLVGIFTMNSH